MQHETYERELVLPATRELHAGAWTVKGHSKTQSLRAEQGAGSRQDCEAYTHTALRTARLQQHMARHTARQQWCVPRHGAWQQRVQLQACSQVGQGHTPGAGGAGPGSWAAGGAARAWPLRPPGGRLALPPAPRAPEIRDPCLWARHEDQEGGAHRWQAPQLYSLRLSPHMRTGMGGQEGGGWHNCLLPCLHHHLIIECVARLHHHLMECVARLHHHLIECVASQGQAPPTPPAPCWEGLLQGVCYSEASCSTFIFQDLWVQAVIRL